MRSFEQFETFFASYCHKYIQRCGADDTNLRLKIDHSFNVAEQALRLADNESFDEGLSFLCRLAGLFHDIGRFEQYERYNTFKDTDSVDHARLGFSVLTRLGVFNCLSREQSRCIRLAVFFHSRKGLPHGLPGEISSVCKAVRDCDKLDIIPIMISHLTPGNENNSVVTLGLENQDRISPQIWQQVNSCRLCDYSSMKYLNDFKLLLCSWVYDQNYSYSRKFVFEKDYISQIFKILPSGQNMEILKGRVLAYLEESS